MEDVEAFRARFRAFLAANRPGKVPRDERITVARGFAARLTDAGFAAPAWPERFGGMELPVPLQLVYYEELAKARVPGLPGTGMTVGPTIIRHGSEEQQHRFLRRLLRADDVWCQGYSEPGAGSDLPSLKTRAVRDGDEYVVSGHKIWTTSADVADWMFALVRTGPEGSRERGISFLLIDMRSPGVTVRPLRDLTGAHDFNEVFLDDVRVPIANRIGPENEGWRITRTSLGHERATAGVAQQLRYRQIMRELADVARERGRNREPHVRQEIARYQTLCTILTMNAARVLGRVMRGEDPGALASLNRLTASLFEQGLHELAVEILGMHGLVDRRDPRAFQRGRWTRGFLRTRASTIGAGTAEIQRNTIAEQVLGLPRALQPAGRATETVTPG